MAGRRRRLAWAALAAAATGALLFVFQGRRPGSHAEAPPTRAAHFSGHVRNLLGRGLSRAVVHAVWVASDAEPKAFDQVVADDQGAYRLEVRLPAGEKGQLLLMATAEGHETGGRGVDPERKLQNFVLAAGGARVTLRVRDEAGRPVPRADVTLTVEPQAGEPDALAIFSGASGPDGNYVVERVTTAAASLHWSAAAAGRGSAFGRQDKPWGEAPALIEIRIRAGAVVTGSAVDEQDVAVPGVDISLSEAEGPWGKHATSDALGRFTIRDVPTGERLTLRPSAEGHMLANGQDQLEVSLPAQSRAQDLRVTLQPAGLVLGAVHAASGKAIAGATIEAKPADHRPQGRRNAATLADGSFRLGGLRLSSDWELEIRHPDYAPAFVERLRPARSGERVDVTLHAGGTVAGRVLFDDGSPADDVEIYAHRVEQTGQLVVGLREHATRRTGKDGSWKIEHLNPGQVRIEVRPKARMAWASIAAKVDQLQVEEGRTTEAGDAVLRRPGALSATLTGSGRELADALVYLAFMRAGAGGAPQEMTLQRGPSGVLLVPDLEPGDYDLSFRLAQSGFVRVPGVTIRPGETTRVSVEVPVRLAIEGRVLRSDRTPAAGAHLDLFLANAGTQHRYPLQGRAPDNFSGNSAVADSQGRFRVGGLDAEKYRLYVTLQGETPLDSTINVGAESTPIGLSFYSGGSCEVKILDDRKLPLPDKIVVIDRTDGGPRHSISAVTAADGSAKFSNLPVGEYEARAVVAGQPRTACRVMPGERTKVEVHASR